MTLIQTLRYHYTNCFLIELRDGWLLFDSDMSDSLPAFYKALKIAGVTINDIRCQLVSHFHPDHCGLAQALKEQGVPLIVMEFQQDFLDVPVQIMNKGGRQFFTPIREDDNLILSASASRAFLQSLGLAGEVLYTPGHSDDSATLILDEGYAFNGDLPLPDLVDGYDSAVMAASWRKIMTFKPKVLLSGHWPQWMVAEH